MNSSSTNPILALALLAGALCIGFLIIFVVMPFLGRFSLVFEALTLLADGLGEYIGNPGLVRLGCLVVALMVVGCCIITFVGAGTLISCTMGNSTALCRLLGR